MSGFNAISIIIEILQFAVKMACKMTIITIPDFDQFSDDIFLHKRNRDCSAHVLSCHVMHE